jgi:hypothetical protein
MRRSHDDVNSAVTAASSKSMISRISLKRMACARTFSSDMWLMPKQMRTTRYSLGDRPRYIEGRGRFAQSIRPLAGNNIEALLQMDEHFGHMKTKEGSSRKWAKKEPSGNRRRPVHNGEPADHAPREEVSRCHRQALLRERTIPLHRARILT